MRRITDASDRADRRGGGRRGSGAEPDPDPQRAPDRSDRPDRGSAREHPRQEDKEGLHYRAAPEFNQSPVFVDTGPLEAESAVTYDLELSWRRGPWWVAAELLRSGVESPQLGNPVFTGYHVSGSWVLTREMRPYNRRSGTLGPVPVSRSVYQGGPGAWEVTARYSRLDLSDGQVDGGEMDIVSLGLNWFLTPTFAVNFNYRHIVLDRDGVRGRSDGLMGRVILMLE